MRNLVEIGDLICYNCAGMKNHTVGIILEEWHDTSDGKRYIKIMWGMKGKVMPRASYDYYHKHNIENPDWQRWGVEAGKKDILWYAADKNYFSVIQ